MSPERSEVEFFNFSAASRRTLQIVPTMSSEVQTLVNRNIFMTTGIYSTFYDFINHIYSSTLASNFTKFVQPKNNIS
ncbi:MAG: hypothetical protein V3T59_05575 [Desulfobacterales bacterium]